MINIKKSIDDAIEYVNVFVATKSTCGREMVVWIDVNDLVGKHFQEPGVKVGDEVTLTDGRTKATVIYNAGKGIDA